MKKPILVSSLFVSMLAMHVALAESVAVIVNSANMQNVSPSGVKNIYTDKIIAWENGARIVAYNLPTEDDATEIFARKILGMSAREAAGAESNRIITNTARNPQQTRRAVLVIAIIAKTPNAIGYAPKEEVAGKSGIRVLFTLE